MVRSKDGTQIAFTKVGEGPALICVSGALSARALSMRLPLVSKLAEHYSTYSYDRRGRGESGDTQPYAVDREIEDLEALIDLAGGSSLILGISSGAALSMQAAAKLGAKKISKLALYEPPYGQKPEEFEKQKTEVNRLIKTGEPGDAAVFFLTSIGLPAEAIEKMKTSPGWQVMKTIDHTLAYDYEVLGDGQIPEQAVSTISVPTLIMDGEKSLDFMHSTADRIAELIPNSERTTFKGLAHQIDADIVTPRLIEFVGR
jgi:pimeloyl-ACP methyl ester carboxylesterase